jgi:phosphatidylglycerophosphate synthase
MAGSPEPALLRRQRPWRALSAAGGGALAGIVAATAGHIFAAASVLVSLIGFVLGAALVSVFWPRAAFGAANTVTLCRVVGASWAAGLACQAVLMDLSPTGETLLLTIGVVCLILDGVDGRLARATGQHSVFGARFDMETDAALLLLLSVAVAALGITSWWVTSIGAMRYLYVAAFTLWPALRIPVFYSYARRVVAVIQGVALLAALALDLLPGSDGWAPDAILLFALGTLCWSFGRDIVWQLRQAKRRRSAPCPPI